MAGPKTIIVRDGETINSVVRRIRNTVENSVILKSDGADDLLLNEVNLRLIRYYADEDGKQVVIESANPAVRRLCQSVGLFGPGPVISEYIDAAQSDLYLEHASASLEGAPVPAISRPKHRPIWIWLLPLAVMAAISVWMLLWANPGATVIIHPAVRQMVTDIRVEASVGLKKPDLKTRRLPATLIERQDEIVFTVPTTGRATVGFTASRGIVAFINDNPSPVTVPKGTIVATRNGVRFATTKEIVVPRRTVELFAGVPAGLKAGQAEVAIECTEKGIMGNVTARRIQMLQGPLADKLRVVNPEPAFGGDDRQIRVVSRDDLERGKLEASNQALAAANGILSQLVGKRMLFDELISVDIQSVQASHEVNDETAEIKMTATFRASTIVVDREVLAKLVSGCLATTLPPSFGLAESSVRLTEVVAAPKGLRGAVLHVSVESRVFGIVDSGKISRGLLGRTDAEARQYLSGIEEVGQYKMRVPRSGRLPRWSPRLRVIVVDPS